MLEPEFLGGVVEGFYGQNWAQHERLDLIDQMAALRLNTYFYAPKNDLKHRVIWRECYNESELVLIREIAKACDTHGLRFVYGLSPGLDIHFSDEAERDQIKARFGQLWEIGVQHFALLFDDLPGKMCEEDRKRYQSLAAAHSDVTNAIFDWVHDRFSEARFLFCPTPYCERMDRAQLGGAGYLDEVGRLLRSEIDILWTGPEIVSAEISVELIERLTRRLGRPPMIWDNLFANDYDFRRLYCGSYAGRSRDLRRVVRGILINPNNEYPINFIPLRTFSAFLSGDGQWQPREAFLESAARWLPRFGTVTTRVALDDLVLLADCFYLPFSEGPEAEKLLGLIHRLLTEPVADWGDAYQQLSDLNARIQTLFDRLTELRDRELFNAWSRRIWDLKEELLVIEAILAQKRAGRDIGDGVELEICLPGTFRGGVLAKLQRFVSMDAQGKIKVQTAR